MPHAPRLCVAAAALPLSLAFVTSETRAQYASGFEALAVAPGAVAYAPDLWDPAATPGTLGQDDYYAPNATSVPFQAQIYTGGAVLAGFNTYGLPDNPNGGNQFIVGEGPAGGVFARAQRDISYPPSPCGNQRWVWGTDILVSYNGVLPAAQNCGSFSVQPFPGSQSFIMLARWTDVNTAAQWNADYIWFDAAGAQVTTSVTDPAFQNLDVDKWYRWETVGNLVTNEIEEVRIIDLAAGTSTSVVPVGAYMEGGTAGSAAPTGFRFFAGGGVAGNLIAWDNASVAYAGGVREIPGCGSNPANSLTVTTTPAWPTLGSTIGMALDAPAGSTGVGSIGAVFLSLTESPALPCGIPVPGFTGNALIGLPIGASLASLTPWAGPGSPVTLTFALPNNQVFSGICVYIQGAFVDLASGAVLLTTAAEVEIGN